ncbi:MAG: hypothetical protein ACOZDD_14070 [Bacteroidota bacterium]
MGSQAGSDPSPMALRPEGAAHFNPGHHPGDRRPSLATKAPSLLPYALKGQPISTWGNTPRARAPPRRACHLPRISTHT